MKDLNIEPSFDFDPARERDPLTIQPLDQDYTDDDQDPSLPRRPPHFKVAAVIAFVNENLYDIFQLANTSGTFLFLDPSLDMLDKMRNLILMLMIHDHSRNTDYAKGLSQTWHQVIEYFTPNVIARIPKAEIKHIIKSFIEDVKSYPKKADHSLGYYLQKYAGENWLPFPFIGILKNLHEDHAKRGDASQLNHWFNELSELLDYFSTLVTTKKK